jgi:hypothetical protein
MRSGAIIELDKVESCDIDFSEESSKSQYTTTAYTAYSPPLYYLTRTIRNFMQADSAHNLIELETLDLNEVAAIVRVY